MAEVAGAALGVLIEKLLKQVTSVIELTLHFKSVLEKIKSNLDNLSCLLNKLEEVGNFLDDQGNTNNLMELISKGDMLIQKCDAIKHTKLHWRVPNYTKRLRNFDVQLERAEHHLVLQLTVEVYTEQARMSGGSSSNSNSNSNSLRCLWHSVWDKMKIKLTTKIMGVDRCYRDRTPTNHASAQPRLPLIFYDDHQLNGNKFEEKIKVWRYDQREIFHWIFETVAGEKLNDWFHCYFTAISGPLEGVLYASNKKLTFCSRKRIQDAKKEVRSYLKVIIPVQLLMEVDPNSSEILKIITIDSQEFSFTKFKNYNNAKMCLQELRINTK